MGTLFSCLFKSREDIHELFRSSNPKSQHPNELTKAHCIILGASVRSHIGIRKSGTELESNITTSVIVYSRIECCSFSSCNNKIKESKFSQVSDLVYLRFLDYGIDQETSSVSVFFTGNLL
jgi:hypothetical protein